MIRTFLGKLCVFCCCNQIPFFEKLTAFRYIDKSCRLLWTVLANLIKSQPYELFKVLTLSARIDGSFVVIVVMIVNIMTMVDVFETIVQTVNCIILHIIALRMFDCGIVQLFAVYFPGKSMNCRCYYRKLQFKKNEWRRTKTKIALISLIPTSDLLREKIPESHAEFMCRRAMCSDPLQSRKYAGSELPNS